MSKFFAILLAGGQVSWHWISVAWTYVQAGWAWASKPGGLFDKVKAKLVSLRTPKE